MKKILTCLLVVIMIGAIGISVLANTSVNFPQGGTSNSTVNNAVGNVWNTFATVVQVLALGTVVFAGLRYMFASADKKADIKRGMGYLAIGAMFVFGASTIARFIVNAGDNII